jgi:tetratricopeptide (TPR) repeat protein
MAYSIAWKCALRNQDKLHRIFELCDIVVQEKSARRTDAYYRYVQRERDSVKRCENYYWLVSPLTSEGRFAEAIDAINRMDIQQNRDSCLAEVAERQVYAGDIEGATVTVNAIQSPESQTRAMAYVETLRACRLVEQGAIEEGKQIFASLSTQAASITDDYVRSVITGAVLDGQAKLGFWDDAITTAKQSGNLWRIMELQSRNGLFSEAKAFSERYGLTISALSSIAADEMRAGQINNARKTFQQAIHLAQSTEHDLARYWSLFSVASQQFAGGDTAYAEQTLDCAWEISSRIQSKHNYDLWNRQVQMGCRYAENGLVEQVIRRNEEVFWWRDCHLHAVVQALKRYVDKKPKEGKVIQSSSLNTLLISCAYYSSATFAACSLLADLYPEQAAAVGHALAKDEADHRASERGLPALVKNVTALFRKKSDESSTG